MKTSVLFILVVISLLLVRCTTDDPTPNDPNVVNVTNDITKTTVWHSDTIYVIDDADFWITASLTIQAGAIIKFSSGGKYMTISSSGTVNATGTVLKPIILPLLRTIYTAETLIQTALLPHPMLPIGEVYLASRTPIFLNTASSIMEEEAHIIQLFQLVQTTVR